MNALGFDDASSHRQITDNQGIDLVSPRAVAMVKAEALDHCQVGLLHLDALDAPHQGKTKMCYALSYSKEAVDRADTFKVALFTMDTDGKIEVASNEARYLTLRANKHLIVR
jgi:hypothetical protein